MAGGIVLLVSLALDDSTHEPSIAALANEEPPQQVPGDYGRWASVETPAEGRAWRPVPVSQGLPFFRNCLSLGRGHVLITSSGVSQPRCAIPTPYLMKGRCTVEWESVSTANLTP